MARATSGATACVDSANTSRAVACVLRRPSINGNSTPLSADWVVAAPVEVRLAAIPPAYRLLPSRPTGYCRVDKFLHRRCSGHVTRAAWRPGSDRRRAVCHAGRRPREVDWWQLGLRWVATW